MATRQIFAGGLPWLHQRKRGSLSWQDHVNDFWLLARQRLTHRRYPPSPAAFFVISWSMQAPGSMVTAVGSAHCRAGRLGLAGIFRPRPTQQWWPASGTAGSSRTPRCSSQSSALRSAVMTSPRSLRWCHRRSVRPRRPLARNPVRQQQHRVPVSGLFRGSILGLHPPVPGLP